MPFSNTVRHKMETEDHMKSFVAEPLVPYLMVRDVTTPLDKLNITGLMAWVKWQHWSGDKTF